MAGDHRHWSSWLANAEAVRASVGDEVRYYAAIELDQRGIEPFVPLGDRLHEVRGLFETFSFDDGSEVRTTDNRLVRICAGQNFGSHYAAAHGASHVLFVATDVVMPDDVLPRLLELDWPICGLNIPTYCLGQGAPSAADAIDTWGCSLGPTTAHRPYLGPNDEWDVRVHMQSAALLLVRRDVFTRLRWRTDPDRGMTDDPCYHADARDFLGWETLVRHDVQASHYPEAVGAMETRHTEEARTVRR
jgi:hypothetical protein